MNKNDFMGILKEQLILSNVNDIEDVLAEYEEHFKFKMADGYSEEQVVAKLGDPLELARQFISDEPRKKARKGAKLFTGLGLAFLDIFVGCVFIVLLVGVIALAAISASCVVIGILLIAKMNIASLLPTMPYQSAALFAVSFFALAILSFISTIYSSLSFKQLTVSYARFHKNTMAKAANKAVYPGKASFFSVSGKLKRTLRTTVLIAVFVFLVAFIAAFIFSAINAGNIEFWHVWKWFQ